MPAERKGLDLHITDHDGDRLVFESNEEGYVTAIMLGREGEASGEAFVELTPADQKAIVKFLLNL